MSKNGVNAGVCSMGDTNILHVFEMILRFFSFHVSVHMSPLILMKSTRLCDWQVVWIDVLVEWKSIAMVDGELCVTHAGRRKKLQWPVICWIVEWSNISQPLTPPASNIKMNHSGILTVTRITQTYGSVLSLLTINMYAWTQKQLGWFATVSNMFCVFLHVTCKRIF